MEYQSVVRKPSAALLGVEFELARMSFGRRLELMKQVRELSQRREFHQAGETPADRMEAALLSMEIDRLYWQWGLRAVHGLQLDGVPATVEGLWATGPEALSREILEAIRAEAGLTETERKN